MWFNIEFFHTQAGDFTHYLAEADNWGIGVDKIIKGWHTKFQKHEFQTHQP